MEMPGNINVAIMVSVVALSLSSAGGDRRFIELSRNEQADLVWMALAARAAYPDAPAPLGYRPFSRLEWNVCASGCDEIVYTGKGYFTVGNSGLRGRLLVDKLNDDCIVLALSGCDMELESVSDGIKDVMQGLSHYLAGYASQYEQALRIMNAVLASKPRSEMRIAGHSLGGSLATYLALKIPDGRTRITCATFNGFGVSPRLKLGDECERLAAVRICNVYCEGDLIYSNSLWKGARHFGPSYALKANGGWLDVHGIDNMVKLMNSKLSFSREIMSYGGIVSP